MTKQKADGVKKQNRKWVKAAAILGGIVLVLPAIFLLAFLLANHTNGKLISSGETRRYLLYVPPTYNPAKDTPLVINIHGYAQWPANQRDISNWNDLADEQGFIVVYPMGREFPLRWSSHAPVADSEQSRSDVRFISDLIAKLSAEYHIDTKRIYASGLSNGGGMSFMLACTVSEQIASIGGVGGAYTYPWEACNPSRPVPLIVFHGMLDEIVPFNGGASNSFDIPFPNIPMWVETYADRNGCSEKSEIPSQGAVAEIHYTACSENADVVFYSITDGGHSWPGGDPLPEFIVGKTSQDIDATRVMWQFFVQHPMP